MQSIRRLKDWGGGYGFNLRVALMTHNPNLVSTFHTWNVEGKIAMSSFGDVELEPLWEIQRFIGHGISQS